MKLKHFFFHLKTCFICCLYFYYHQILAKIVSLEISIIGIYKCYGLAIVLLCLGVAVEYADIFP